jgi:PAS domain S-box-containing protein
MSFKTDPNKQHLSEQEIAKILVELRNKNPESVMDADEYTSAPGQSPLSESTLRTDLFDNLRSRRRFKPEDVYLLHNSISDVMIWADMEGLITYATQSVEPLLGYTAEILAHRSFLALSNPEDSEKVHKLISSHKDTATIQLSMIAQDRSLIPVEARFDAIFDNKQLITGYCITLRRIVAVTDGAGRNDGMNKILEDLPVAIFAHYDGSFQFSNKMLSVITGYYPDDFEKMSVWALFHPDDSQKAKDIQQNLTENTYESTFFEARLIHRDKSVRTCEFNAKLLRLSTGSSIVVSVQDITKRKKLEEELKQSKNVAETVNLTNTDFLSMMSHEIRTPMNGVIGLTSLLLNTNLTSEQRNYVETIQESGDTLLSTINEILDYSWIESGKMKLEETTFKLCDCVEKALDPFSQKAVAKSLDLLYLIQPEVSHYLSGDAVRLRQVLASLVNNAFQYAERGEISVTVERLSEHNSVQELRFSVRHSGAGIPDEEFNSILEAFPHPENSKSIKPGSPVLGLVIAKRIVKMLGGELWVENSPEHGSTSFFTACFRSSQMSKAKRYIRGQAAELVNKRVLIADTNQIDRLILKLQFELWGMIPTFAESDEQVHKLMKGGQHFDLILVDMLLPGMGSVELGKQIKNLQHYSKVPIIFLSTTGRINPIPGNEFGSHLMKPVKLDELFENVLELMIQDRGMHIPMPSEPVPQLNLKLSEQLPLKILVVEDNLLNQKLVVSLLGRMGYKAEVADNGLIAYELAKREAFDIIFMDVQMPEMDGIEATQAILHDNSNAKAPRIIAITANVMQGDREKCLQSGMVDYLAKPVRIHEIQEMLQKWS